MKTIRQRIAELTVAQRELLNRWLMDRQADHGKHIVQRRGLTGYVVVSTEDTLSAERLREYLKERLPDFMVPDRMIVLGELPRLPNGKVDLKRLPDSQPDKKNAQSDCQTPRTETERILATIWSALLPGEELSVHDNFFEIGGDSILSIQLVSRAREAGLKMDPGDLVDNPTIAELACVVKASAKESGRNDQTTGISGVTPIQHWFLNRDLAAPHHWNQSQLLAVDERLTEAQLGYAVETVFRHHDALRARFLLREGFWIQDIPDDETPQLLECVTLQESDRENALSRHVAALQAEFEIRTGRLIRFVLFAREDGRPYRLLIAAHHLIVDRVSWSVLLSDLNRLCEQLTNRLEVGLASKTTSVLQWVKHLSEYAGSVSCQEALPFWVNVPRDGRHSIPLDRSPSRIATEAAAMTVSKGIDREATNRLLTQANEAYNTHTMDVLVTALSNALSRWTGRPEMTIDLEGHGRENIASDVDLGRTVGWLTSFFPCSITLPADSNPEVRIKAVKEQLRAIPNRGLAFGVLKYLSADSSVRKSLEHLPDADVLFNFSGTASEDDGNLLLRPVPGGEVSGRAGKNQLSHLLEINVGHADGCLTAVWKFSPEVHHPATIERLAQSFIDDLMQLIQHCTSLGTMGFTPSDFPESGLNQHDLDEFLDDL